MKCHYTSLANRIGAKKYPMVLNILNENQDLDVTYNEGSFFIVAIKNNSYDIAQELLKYFEDNQLNMVSDANEYESLKMQMENVLRIAIEDIDLSKEMKKALSRYIDFEDNSHDEGLRDSFSDKDQTTSNINYSTLNHSKKNLLTEENLKKLSTQSSEEKFRFIENIAGHYDEYQEIKGDSLIHKEHHTDLAGNLLNNDEL